MGFASVLDDDVLGPLTDAQHGYMGKILDGSDRLLALINDLLDMSRIQAGKFAITPSDVAVSRVCEGAVGALQPLADQQGVTLSLEAADGLPTVWADPQRLEQVVTNLVSNAIKFTPEGGTVTVAVRGLPDHLRVEVRDTGMGISPEHHARIFDAFTQVDMSNTRRSGGAGLGLAIAKSLVEAHQGHIGVESEEGRGSTFWFTVPHRADAPPD
ncbi:Alkaline phosphatase synthesis sensor protein PhoR [compost metagenome]